MKLEIEDNSIINGIIDELSFLEDSRYEVTEISKAKGDGTGDTVCVKSSSDKVTVSYNYMFEDKEYPAMVYIYISNDKNRFLLQHFLKFISQEDKYAFINVNKLPKQEFIRSTVNLFKSLIQSHLRGVIDGKEWIDVPFDWHGYK